MLTDVCLASETDLGPYLFHYFCVGVEGLFIPGLDREMAHTGVPKECRHILSDVYALLLEAELN